MSTFTRLLSAGHLGYVLQHLSAADRRPVFTEVHAPDGNMLGTVTRGGTLHLTATDEEGRTVVLSAPETVEAVLQACGGGLTGRLSLHGVGGPLPTETSNRRWQGPVDPTKTRECVT